MKSGASSAITSNTIQIPKIIIATPITIAPFDIVLFGCLGLYVFSLAFNF